jgi:SAM-dependent methyltransferase
MDLEDYLARVRRNRFIPMPGPEQIFVGGSQEDFRQIGVDTLRSLVKHCKIGASGKVLDVGCGIGRVALPLTQWLDDSGEYLGFDVVESGIRWCNEYIAGKYPNFRFLHLNLQNDYYNPAGVANAGDVMLPAPNRHFDLALFSSVFTHLPEDHARAYLELAGRHLAEDGQVWATWFLMDDEARAAVAQGATSLAFDLESGSRTFHLGSGFNRLHAVAYDWDGVQSLYASHGFEIALLQRGNWCARAGKIGGGYQDLIVANRQRA